MPLTTKGSVYYGSTLIASGAGSSEPGAAKWDSEVFTASGTFTVPEGVTDVHIWVQGGNGSRIDDAPGSGQTQWGTNGGTSSVTAAGISISAPGGHGSWSYLVSPGSSWSQGNTAGSTAEAFFPVAAGSSLAVTVGTGNGKVVISWPVSGASPKSQLFTASGTFTVPFGVTRVFVRTRGGNGTHSTSIPGNGTKTYGAAGGTTSVTGTGVSLSSVGGEGTWLYNVTSGTQYGRNPTHGVDAEAYFDVMEGQALTVTVGAGAGAYALIVWDKTGPAGGTPDWQATWPYNAPFPPDPASSGYTIPGTLVDTITASGTWTPPAGVSLVHVVLVGGGGTGGDTGQSGGGGTGGGVRVFRNIPVSGDIPVVVGGPETATIWDGSLTAPAGRRGGTMDNANGNTFHTWNLSPNASQSTTDYVLLGYGTAWGSAWDNPTTAGGDGVQINGTYYAGGGGGSGSGGNANGGAGGAGGGGQGGHGYPSGGGLRPTTGGTNGLGGGGGGRYKYNTSNDYPAGVGGSGVILVYSEDI
jgi:hypothetical protein